MRFPGLRPTEGKRRRKKIIGVKELMTYNVPLIIIFNDEPTSKYMILNRTESGLINLRHQKWYSWYKSNKPYIDRCQRLKINLKKV